jgi:SPP1 gp7 family putative phage head morphogenesis protein
MSAEDTLTRRQVFIQRFAEGQANAAEKSLLRIYAKAQARIIRGADDITLGRLNTITRDIERILSTEFIDFQNDIRQGVLDFAENQAEFTTKALQAESTVILNTVDQATLEQTVFARGMDAVVGPSKTTLNEAFDKFAANKSRDVIQAINDGVLLGQSTGEINKEVLAQLDGVERKSKSQAKTLVRTAINHTAAMAEKVVVEENQAFFENEEWVATLDTRTTLICAGRDGRIYPLGQGPYPPAHWNCRSHRVPILKDEFALPQDKTDRPSEVDMVTGQTKFDGWLRRQPAGFQDEYFSQFPDGLEKAALFRRGGLEIQQFRTETGKDYTLDELRNLEPLAFRQANVE